MYTMQAGIKWFGIFFVVLRKLGPASHLEFKAPGQERHKAAERDSALRVGG